MDFAVLQRLRFLDPYPFSRTSKTVSTGSGNTGSAPRFANRISG